MLKINTALLVEMSHFTPGSYEPLHHSQELVHHSHEGDGHISNKTTGQYFPLFQSSQVLFLFFFSGGVGGSCFPSSVSCETKE